MPAIHFESEGAMMRAFAGKHAAALKTFHMVYGFNIF